MRIHPSRWHRTLTALGLRRNPSRHVAPQTRGWHTSLESLEPRRVLSAYYAVNTLDDVPIDLTDSQWSLREALVAAAGNTTADTIAFDPSLVGNLLLTQGELTVDSDVTIVGPGADILAIDAQGTSGAVRVTSGVNATIEGLTIRGGLGTGITVSGDVTLKNVEIAGNTGVGARVSGNTGASLQVIDSTIAENTGHGVHANAGAIDSVSLFNTTIANNGGDGFHLDSGSDFTFINTTIVGNAGIGIVSEFTSGVPKLHNTLVVNNTSGDLFRSFDSASSYNIVGTQDQGGVIHGSQGNLVLQHDPGLDVVDVALAPLGYYGGPTRTRALLSRSIAVDAGNDVQAALVGFLDQRGLSRLVDSGDADGDGNVVDVGAFELQRTSLQVDHLTDENDGDYGPGDLSLREALQLAAAADGADTVTFAESLSGKLVLLQGELFVDTEVTIVGPGSELLTISGDGFGRVFSLGVNADVSLEGLTVADGSFSGSGGGIYSSGNLRLTDIVVRDSTATSGGGIYHGGGLLEIVASSILDNNASSVGGGIYLISSGLVTIDSSTIAQNNASYVGGIYANSTSLTIANSTLSTNVAANGFGGGAYFYGTTGVNVSLTNVTVASNDAGTGFGGGLYSSGSLIVAVHNSIIVNNLGGSDTYGSSYSTSSSYNVIGDDLSGRFSAANNNQLGITAAQAGLAALGDYGGPTLSHALTVGSVAIDAGSDALAVSNGANDQRGLSRFVNSGDADGDGSLVDVGAVEHATSLVVTSSADVGIGFGEVSLRQALHQAALLTGAVTITFDDALFASGPATIALAYDGADADQAADQLFIDGQITMVGPGSGLLTISGGRVTRVFSLGANADVSLEGLTVADGFIFGSGGGIYSEGALRLTDVVVRDNSASRGSGIYHRGNLLQIVASSILDNDGASVAGGVYLLSGGSVTIDGSTIARNTARSVGGIYAYATPLTITNSTLSGNKGTRGYGAAYFYGTAGETVSLTNVTVANNNGGTGAVGGLYASGMLNAAVHNSIIANSVSGSDVVGTAFSTASSYNVIGTDTSGAFSVANNNQLGVTAAQLGLAALGDYGGSTHTHALAEGSVAIDAGNDAIASAIGLVTDQRGTVDITFGRVAGNSVDAGSYEAGAALIAITNPPLANSAYTSGSQYFAEVGVDGNGNSVSIWSGTGAAGWGLHGQRLNTAGMPLGEPFNITVGSVSGGNWDVGVDESGDFVVVWSELVSDGSRRLFARRYEVVGETLREGTARQLADGTLALTKYENDPSVVINGDAFFVAWSGSARASLQSTVYSNPNVYAQKFRFDGLDIVAVFDPVVITNDDPQKSENLTDTGQSIALDASGNFHVVWRETGSPHSSIYLRGYDGNSGAALGPAQLVTTTADAVSPFAATASNYDSFSDSRWANELSIAVTSDGDVAVGWTTRITFSYQRAVPYVSGSAYESHAFFRQYDAGTGWKSTVPIADTFYRYESLTSSTIYEGDRLVGFDMAADALGRIGVVWSHDAEVSQSGFDSLVTRWYDTAGESFGGPFVQNTPGTRYRPQIATNAEGHFVVNSYMYDSTPGGTGYDVHAEHYQLNRAPRLSDEYHVMTIPASATDDNNVGVPIEDLTQGVTDADAGARFGIAVVATNTSRGEIQFSLDDGATWFNVGAVSETAALLLAADGKTRLRLDPSAPFVGELANAVTFRAWDRTAGANGQTADLSSLGDGSAVSSAVDTLAAVEAVTPTVLPVVTGLQLADGAAPALQGVIPILVGNVSNPFGSNAGVRVEFDVNRDRVADGSVFSVVENESGEFIIDLTETFFAFGEVEVAARAVVLRDDTIQLVVGDWTEYTFDYQPPSFTPPSEEPHLPSPSLLVGVGTFQGTLDPTVTVPTQGEEVVFAGTDLRTTTLGPFSSDAFANRFYPTGGTSYESHTADTDATPNAAGLADTWTYDIVSVHDGGGAWTFTESFVYYYTKNTSGTGADGAPWTQVQWGEYSYSFTASGNATSATYDLMETRTDNYDYGRSLVIPGLTHTYDEDGFQTFTLLADGTQDVVGPDVLADESWNYTSNGEADSYNSYVQTTSQPGGSLTTTAITDGLRQWQYDSKNTRHTKNGATTYDDDFFYSLSNIENFTNIEDLVTTTTSLIGGVSTTRGETKLDTLTGVRSTKYSLDGKTSLNTSGALVTDSSYDNVQSLNDNLVHTGLLTINVDDNAVAGRTINTKMQSTTTSIRDRDYYQHNTGLYHSDASGSTFSGELDGTNDTVASWTTMTTSSSSGEDKSDPNVTRTFSSQGMSTEAGLGLYHFDTKHSLDRVGASTTESGDANATAHSSATMLWDNSTSSSVNGETSTGATTTKFSGNAASSDRGHGNYVSDGWTFTQLLTSGVVNKSGENTYLAMAFGKTTDNGDHSAESVTVETPSADVTITTTTNTDGKTGEFANYTATASGKETILNLQRTVREDNSLKVDGTSHSSTDQVTDVVRIDLGTSGNTLNSTDNSTYTEHRNAVFGSLSERSLDDVDGAIATSKSVDSTEDGTTRTTTTTDSYSHEVQTSPGLSVVTISTGDTQRKGKSKFAVSNASLDSFATGVGSTSSSDYEYDESGSYELSGKSKIDVDRDDTTDPGLTKRSDTTTSSAWDGTGSYEQSESEEQFSSAAGTSRFVSESDYSSQDETNSTTNVDSTSTVIGTQVSGDVTTTVDSKSEYAELRDGHVVTTTATSSHRSHVNGHAVSTSRSANTFDEDGTTEWTLDVTSSTSTDDLSVTNFDKHSKNDTKQHEEHKGSYRAWDYTESARHANGTFSSSDESGSHAAGTTLFDNTVDTSSNSTDTRTTGVTRTSSSISNSTSDGSGAYETHDEQYHATFPGAAATSRSLSWQQQSNDGKSKWSSQIDGKIETHTNVGGVKTDAEETDKIKRSGDSQTVDRSYETVSTIDGLLSEFRTADYTDDGTFLEETIRDSKQDIETTVNSGSSTTVTKSHAEAHSTLNSNGSYSVTSSDYYQRFTDGTTESENTYQRDEKGHYDDLRTGSGNGSQTKTDTNHILSSNYDGLSSDNKSADYTSQDVDISRRQRTGEVYAYNSSKYDATGTLDDSSSGNSSGTEDDDRNSQRPIDRTGGSSQSEAMNGTFSIYDYSWVEDPFTGPTSSFTEAKHIENGTITDVSFSEWGSYDVTDTTKLSTGVTITEHSEWLSNSDGTGKYSLDDQSITIDGKTSGVRKETNDVDGTFSYDSKGNTNYSKTGETTVNSDNKVDEKTSGKFVDAYSDTITTYDDGTWEQKTESSRVETDGISTSTDKTDATSQWTKDGVSNSTVQDDDLTLDTTWSSENSTTFTRNRDTTTLTVDYDSLDETAKLTWAESTKSDSNGGSGNTTVKGHDYITSAGSTTTTEKYNWTISTPGTGPASTVGSSTSTTNGNWNNKQDAGSDVASTFADAVVSRTASDINTRVTDKTYTHDFSSTHTRSSGGVESYSGGGTQDYDFSTTDTATEKWVYTLTDSDVIVHASYTETTSEQENDELTLTEENSTGGNEHRILTVLNDGTLDTKLETTSWTEDKKTRYASGYSKSTSYLDYGGGDFIDDTFTVTTIETKTSSDKYETDLAGDVTHTHKYTREWIDTYESSKIDNQPDAYGVYRKEESTKDVNSEHRDRMDVSINGGPFATTYTSWRQDETWTNSKITDLEDQSGKTADGTWTSHYDLITTTDDHIRDKRTETQTAGSDVTTIQDNYERTYDFYSKSYDTYDSSESNPTSTYHSDTTVTITQNLSDTKAASANYDPGSATPLAVNSYSRTFTDKHRYDKVHNWSSTHEHYGGQSGNDIDRDGSDESIETSDKGNREVGEQVFSDFVFASRNGEILIDVTNGPDTTPIDNPINLFVQLGPGAWDAWTNPLWNTVYDVATSVGDIIDTQILSLLEIAAYSPGVAAEIVLAAIQEGVETLADGTAGVVDGFLDAINPLDPWFSIPDIGPVFGHTDVYTVGYIGGVGLGIAASFYVGNVAAGAGALAKVAKAYTAIDTVAGFALAGQNAAQGNFGVMDTLAFAPAAGYAIKKLDCFVAGTGVWMAGAAMPVVADLLAESPAAPSVSEDHGHWGSVVIVAVMLPAVLRFRRRKSMQLDGECDDFGTSGGTNDDRLPVDGHRRLVDLVMDGHETESKPLPDELPVAWGDSPADDPADRLWMALADELPEPQDHRSRPTFAAPAESTPASPRVGSKPRLSQRLSAVRRESPVKAIPAVSQPKRHRASFAGWKSGLFYAACLLAVLYPCWGFFSSDNMPEQWSARNVPITAAASSVLSPAESSGPYMKPIEEVSVGERVLADNPDPDQAPNFLSEPDEATWRHLKMLLLQGENDLVYIELLRPRTWIEAHQLQAESTVELDLSELGASGPAIVVAIDPCPDILPGDGQVVTGTFAHVGHSIVDVSIGDSPPIGCTATHPFWSEDRQTFVAAGSLSSGERLRTFDDAIVTVRSVARRPTPEPVFNLEVNLEHVYYVGPDGVLVHNVCKITANRQARRELRSNLNIKDGSGIHGHHIVPLNAFPDTTRPAKKILKKHGIEINDAENGAALTWKQHYRQGLHSKKGVQKVVERIVEAEDSGGKKAVLRTLRQLRNEMENHQFKI